MIYVILGMHKSGTTLISEILHQSGINMGDFDPLVSYDSGNKYERQETKSLNYQILDCAKTYSLNVINSVGMSSEKEVYLKKINKLIIKLNHRYDNWGFKDPRTCLTFQVWKEYLNEFRLIVVYRDPLEIWLHYKKRNPMLLTMLNLQICWKAITAWYVYYKNIISYLDDLSQDKFIIINYNKFMIDNREFKRLEDFVGISLNDRRNPDLYRGKRKKSLLFNFYCRIQKRFFSRDIGSIFRRLALIE